MLEVRHDTEPWSVVDVTEDMLSAGRQAQEEAEQTRQGQRQAATEALKAEVAKRAGRADPMRVRPDAEEFLMSRKLTRKLAREVIEDGHGTLWLIETIISQPSPSPDPHARCSERLRKRTRRRRPAQGGRRGA